MTSPPAVDPPKKEPLSPRTQAVLALIQGLLPAMTAIIGGLWIAGTYIHDQKVQSNKEETRRLMEVQRPFLDRKLKMYIEASEVIGKLVTTTPDKPDWEGLERRFWELYWTELTMVEDNTVESAMVTFSKELADYSSQYKVMVAAGKVSTLELEQKKNPLRVASTYVAQALRKSVEVDWTGKHSN